jgi:hypothetical protein
MSRTSRLSLACLAFLVVSISMAAQAPPSADAYVSKISPATNFGSGPILAVQEGTTTYVQFDLSTLPAGARISKATMRLYVNNVVTPGAFDVYLVNEKWSEWTLNYNNAPALGASATGGNAISVSISTLNHFIVVDVTPVVQAWASGSTPNNGIALALTGGSNQNLGSFSFDSKENQLTGHHPELEVVLNATAGAPSPFPRDSSGSDVHTEQTDQPPASAYIWNYYQLGSQPTAAFDISGFASVGIDYEIGKQTVLAASAASGNLSVGLGAGSPTRGVGAPNGPAAGMGVTSVGNGAGAVNTGNNNTFVGQNAGNKNVGGTDNTLVGFQSGLSNTSGVGSAFFGSEAGQENTTGSANTFIGHYAGRDNAKGDDNTFVGYAAGYVNTGSSNVFLGSLAGFLNGASGRNTFVGYEAGFNNVASNSNAYFGYQAGHYSLGAFNTFVGAEAGSANTTGDSNVYIANPGVLTESNTIRIGTQGVGAGQQNATYVAGIRGTNVGAGAVAVLVNAAGQLGTVASSRRFKEQVRDMGDSTSALMRLRPVTFLYKPEYEKGPRTLQYGLIAEEVAEVYPELVAYDNDGKPYSVLYQYLDTMLLNEVQKQYHRVAAEAKVIDEQKDQVEAQRRQIKAQEQKINELEQRLSRLESFIGTEARIAERKPLSVVTGGQVH